MTGTHDAGVTADGGRGSGGTLGGFDTAVVPDAEADTPEDTSVSMGTQATITVGSPGVTVILVTGTSLTVPAGALSATTMIGIATLPIGGATGTADTMPMLPVTLNPSGAIVALTPHGQGFNAPVTIQIPFDTTLASRAAGRPLKLYTASPGGAWTTVDGAQAKGDVLEASVSHFSYFVVGYESPGQILPDNQGRKLDLLFMIDNSTSMAPLQQALLTNFPVLMQVLKNLPGGLPDIHIGVVSSSMGAGRFVDVPGCPTGGDRGILQSAPGILGCQPPRDAYIAAGEGETTKNYEGTIEDTFSCIARLGDQGCGFEHQLESVAIALGARGAAPVENAGFLRPDASLGIVLITNEDDCSAPPDSGLFDVSSMFAADPWGPLNSYRCNQFGHRCAGGVAPPGRSADGSPVTLTDCHSAEDGVLNRIGDYVQMFKALKPDPSQVFIAAITGPPSPYVVDWTTQVAVNDPEPEPRIAHSCMVGGIAYGDPASRISDLLSAFGANGTFSSICDPSFAPALTNIGVSLGQRLGARCLQSELVEGPAGTPSIVNGCAVFESVPAAGGIRTELPLPTCTPGSGAGGAEPCFTVVSNAACASGAELTITRGAAAPNGAVLVVRCD